MLTLSPSLSTSSLPPSWSGWTSKSLSTSWPASATDSLRPSRRLCSQGGQIAHTPDLVLSWTPASTARALNWDTGEYWHSPPPQEYLLPRIQDLELLYHVVCCNILACQWSSKLVQGKTDNKTCFYLLKNGKSREDLRLWMAHHVAAVQVREISCGRRPGCQHMRTRSLTICPAGHPRSTGSFSSPSALV